MKWRYKVSAVITLSIICCFLVILCAGCSNIETETLEKSVALTFDEFPRLSGHLVSVSDVEDMTLSVYQSPDADLYTARVMVNGLEFYLGKSYSEDFELSRSMYTYGHSAPIYYWTEDVGAAATGSITHFFTFDDNTPHEIFTVGALVDFIDLNGDGVPEIISAESASSLTNVEIYFWNENSYEASQILTKINVNQTLNAGEKGVYYKDGIFTVVTFGATDKVQYIYNNGKFISIE